MLIKIKIIQRVLIPLILITILTLVSCRTPQQRAIKHFNKACVLNPDICKKSIKDSVRIKDSTRINIKDSINIIKAGESEIDGQSPCDSTEKTFKGKSGNFNYVLKFFRDGRFNLNIKENQDTKSEVKVTEKESVKEKDKTREEITPPVIVVDKKVTFKDWVKHGIQFSLILLVLFFAGKYSLKYFKIIK